MLNKNDQCNKIQIVHLICPALSLTKSKWFEWWQACWLSVGKATVVLVEDLMLYQRKCLLTRLLQAVLVTKCSLHHFHWCCEHSVQDYLPDLTAGTKRKQTKVTKEQWDVTCRMRLHSVNCQPTQVNTPNLNLSHTGWFTYPRGMEGWVDLGGCLHTEMIYLSTKSPIQVVTGHSV